jgi:2'-5' RNA ligase
MSDQFDFIETMPRPSIINSLFLALFPDGGIAQHMVGLGAGFKKKHGLTGRLRPLDHLHLTLHWIDDYPEIPNSVVEAVGQACESISSRTAPFEVTLDCALSFGRGSVKRPLVLAGNESHNRALSEFHQQLLAELVKCRCLGKGKAKLEPHVTLLYDKPIAECPVAPVSWRAEEIVLVCSEVGATRYQRLGQWKLRA